MNGHEGETIGRDPHDMLSRFSELYERDPDREIFVMVDDAGQDVRSMSVRTMAAEAEQIMQGLESAGVQPGDRAVLVYLPSLEFVSAFLGCMAAGVVPVPVSPPNPFKLAQEAGPLSAVIASADARIVLSQSAYMRAVDAGGQSLRDMPALPDTPWMPTDRWTAEEGPEPDPRIWHRDPDPDDVAFLQYTSGSTGSPKGVVISHGNISHELDAVGRDLGLGEDTVAVTWIPHFHDMGLICFLLTPLAGLVGRTYVMSPMSFLQRPAVWFDVVSRVRATHTAAPNFAYDLAVARTTPEQRAGWDLSCLRVLGSGGEAVDPAAVDRFFEAFSPHSLSRDVFYPAYGLAEHTLTVTMGGSGPLGVDKKELTRGVAVPAPPGSADTVTIYGSGRMSKPDAVLRIVDPESGSLCGPRRVGEIWVDSPTKAKGYWGLANETSQTYHAVLSSDPDRSYLRTGDLGFLHEGELFITGRLKELIIIRGHNHYPEDIEATVRGCHPMIRPDGVAAFSVTSGGTDEELVVLAEVTPSQPPAGDLGIEIVRAIRRGVQQRNGLACGAVIVATEGLVLRTPSGKVRRNACRMAYLERDVAVAR